MGIFLVSFVTTGYYVTSEKPMHFPCHCATETKDEMKDLQLQRFIKEQGASEIVYGSGFQTVF
jgi:hypothetical protein